MTTSIRFTRLGWASLLVVAASLPALAACSRVGTAGPAPASDAALASSAPLESPAPVASSPPLAPPAASTPPALSAPPPRPDGTRPAPAAAVTSRTSGPKSSDCARHDDTPGLSAEDRARSRATCEAKEELREFVAARQSCSSASECTNIGGSCPFGCFLPVAKRSAPEVTAKLEQLGARLDQLGNRCAYRCVGAPTPACVAGRCATGAP